MKRIFLLTLIAFCSFSGIAQTSPKEPTIHVVGTAEMDIVPDEIYMSITLREYMKDKKKYAIEDLEKGLVNYLTSIVKVDLKDIKMENLDARMVNLKRSKNKDEMISKSYEVKLKKSAQAIDVFVAMDSLGMSNAFISSYSHSKMDEYKKQIKINAIKAARDKADYLMAAINQKALKAVRVHEPNGFVVVDDDTRNARYNVHAQAYSNSYLSGGRLDYSEENGENTIGEKTIKLTYSLEVEFLID